MEEHVPAWKKIGLKQKAAPKDSSKDTLNQQIKRKAEQSDSGPKKPPKRVKKPKAERSPPPLPDQIAYLEKFHNDRANWKFQKAKQIWLAKNLFTIDEQHEEALRSYFEQVQGQLRDKILDDSKQVVAEWNEFMSKPLEPEEEEVPQEPEKPEETRKKQKAPKAAPAKVPPTDKMALRAQYFVEQFTGTKPELITL